ncbi:MAG TPA: nucleoside recognition domain-containing protein [Pseudogracilibacillus sp.]|nr:nucleoside recognition domain-containing protein [Pseudogracilibacillus sp.]
MVNIIWALMAMIGIVYAMINGTMADVNEAIFTSAEEGVALTIRLVSVLIFWLGMMNIAKEAGILRFFTRLVRPVVVRLFPDIPKDHPAMEYIVSNMIANMFGLGNAATPIGIKAMEEMKKLSKSTTASRSMITFLAMNTSSFTLIPTTVIAIRMQYESLAPTEIVLTTILASFFGLSCAILLDKFFYHRNRKKGD